METLTDSAETALERARVSLLGPLAVTIGDQPVELRANRQRRLLCILAVSAPDGRCAGVDEIVEALYETSAPPRPKRGLATEIWRLRRLLGTGVVVTEPDGYRLDLSCCELDVAQFEDLVVTGSADLRAGSVAQAQATLARALQLWRGDPLADLSDHPSGQAAIARLQELRVGAMVNHAEALRRTGRRAEAIRALDELTTARPTLEHAWALLVECHLDGADLAPARRCLGTARRLLADQGLDAGPELCAAQERLERTPEHAQFPAIHARPGPLVGREQEIAAIAAAAGAAITARQPTAVVLVGEPGIGKSAVAQAAAQLVADRSGSDVAIHTVHGDPRRERLDGAVTALLDGAESAAGDAPGTVLLIEDAHRCAAATLAAISQIIARRARIPLAVVATVCRPARVAPQVATALGELRKRAAAVIELSGLDETATAALLGPAGADSAAVVRLHRLSGGNPRYLGKLRELGARGGAGVPADAGVSGAIEAHLAGLDQPVIDTLRLAAVIGIRFDTRVLIGAQRLLGDANGAGPAAAMDALRAAVAARLVRMDRGDSGDSGARGDRGGSGDAGGPGREFTAQFVHELVRDHLYQQLASEPRARAHLAVGAAFERVALGREQAFAEIAHHYANAWPACDAASAARRLQAAGEHAALHLDFSLAADYYRRALDLLALGAEVDDTLTGCLLGALGETTMAVGDEHGARSAFAALRRSALREDRTADRLWADLGELRTYGGRAAQPAVLDQLAEDLALVVREPVDEPTVHLVAESAVALYRHRPQHARTLLDSARDTASTCVSEARLAIWEPQGVAEQLATARDLVADPAIDPARSWLRLWVSEVAAGHRALTDAPEQLTALHPAANRGMWEFSLWRIAVAIATGKLSRAVRLLDAAESRVARARSAAAAAGMMASLRGQRMWLALLRADATGVRDVARAIPAAWSVRHAVMTEQLALAAVAEGDRARARRHCDEALDNLYDAQAPGGDVVPRLAMLVRASISCDYRGAIAACRHLLHPHVDEHMVFSFAHYWGPVRAALGQLAAAAGDLDEAIALFGAALDAARAAASTVFETQIRRHLAAALWRRDRGDDRRVAGREQQLAAAAGARIGLWALAPLPWPPASANG